MSRRRAIGLISLPLLVGIVVQLGIWTCRRLNFPKPYYVPIDLHEIGRFPLDEYSGAVADVPEKFRRLEGRRIVVEGFMFPTVEVGDDVHEFQFVNLIQTHSHQGPPRVQERIFGLAPLNKRVRLYNDISRLYGTLHVRPRRASDGKIIALYQLDVDRVCVVDGAIDSGWLGSWDHVWLIGLQGSAFVGALLGLRLVCVSYLQFRRRSRGQCPNCGYDVRATPVRCSECGLLLLTESFESERQSTAAGAS